MKPAIRPKTWLSASDEETEPDFVHYGAEETATFSAQAYHFSGHIRTGKRRVYLDRGALL